MAGPCRVPSFDISVQSTFFTPWSTYCFKNGSSSSAESSFHPFIEILPFLTSAPNISLSAPYSSSQLKNSSGFVTAMLPIVTMLAPASKAFFRSSSVFSPPPKSTFKFVASVIAFSTWSLTICFDFAPSRSTTCRRLNPMSSNCRATSAGESL